MKGEEDIDIWSKYFCNSVQGIGTKQYIIDSILPKPRDLITLVNSALENAINRKHYVIDENDIVDAVTKYSSFAYNTLVTELQLEYPELEEFLLSLLGDGAIIQESILLDNMYNLGFSPERARSLLELLCQMSFLGYEVKPEDFRFCYSSDDHKRYKILAQKMSESKKTTMRYKIHKAFWPELMISG